MKAILEFNLPEEQENFEEALYGVDYKMALWDIAQEIFRPARKHGYDNPSIQTVLNKANEVVVVTDIGDIKDEVGAGSELISVLEKKFYEILEQRGIEL